MINTEYVVYAGIIMAAILFVIYLVLKRESNKFYNLYQDALDIIEEQGVEMDRKVKRALSTQRAVVKGQIAEQMFPTLAELNGRFKASDMMFNGKLFDYIIFEGYTDALEGTGNIRRIIFLDIKTGNARLLPHQEQLKECIRKIPVEFATVRIDDQGKINFEY